MAEVGDTLTGHCLCGAARYTARLKKAEMDACHCSMCRRWSSGPAMVVETEGLAFEDERSVSVFRSSEWGERIFCSTCGSNLAWRAPGAGYEGVAAFTLDPPLELPLKVEIFIDSKPEGYAFAGETHRMTGAEVIAAFAGGAH